MPTFKDIEALLPSNVVTGNEKLPISAYLYLTVQQVAQMAISQITQVTDSLSSRVENIESAEVISPAEKPYISLLIDEIEAKYLYISQRAADKGVSIADLTIAYNNVVPYLSSFVEDMTSSSAVNRDVMNSLVVAFTTQYLKADEACNSGLTTEEAQQILNAYAYSKEESDDRYPQYEDKGNALTVSDLINDLVSDVIVDLTKLI